jgi:HrpA-like RNA helicase
MLTYADAFGRMLTYADVSSSSKGNRGDSVLVFLPGIKSIEDVKEALSEELGRDAEQTEWILPLHGRLSAEDQKRVFVRPPKGVFKVADADVC